MVYGYTFTGVSTKESDSLESQLSELTKAGACEICSDSFENRLDYIITNSVRFKISLITIGNKKSYLLVYKITSPDTTTHYNHNLPGQLWVLSLGHTPHP